MVRDVGHAEAARVKMSLSSRERRGQPRCQASSFNCRRSKGSDVEQFPSKNSRESMFSLHVPNLSCAGLTSFSVRSSSLPALEARVA